MTYYQRLSDYEYEQVIEKIEDKNVRIVIMEFRARARDSINELIARITALEKAVSPRR
jgi:hypothetical protein